MLAVRMMKQMKMYNRFYHLTFQDEDDYIDTLPKAVIQQKAKGPRSSVSAEAFGSFNKKGDFQARVI